MSKSPASDPRLMVVLLTVTYGASVVALWGFVSLLLDEDVIRESDAGPLLGPAMAVAATVVTSVALWRLRRSRSLAVVALATAASAYCLMLLVGAVGYAVTRGELTWLVLFVGRYALSPFVLGPPLLAAATIVAGWWLLPRGHV